jgi:hypothetical protein
MPTETAVSVDELQAGEKLDDLIAERVMGMSADEIAVRRSPLSSALLHDHGYGRNIKPIPAYSTDHGAAWEVAEKMRGKSLVMRLDRWAGDWGPDQYSCYFARCFFDRDDNPEMRLLRGRADSAPLAICRAALKAVT